MMSSASFPCSSLRLIYSFYVVLKGGMCKMYAYFWKRNLDGIYKYMNLLTWWMKMKWVITCRTQPKPVSMITLNMDSCGDFNVSIAWCKPSSSMHKHPPFILNQTRWKDTTETVCLLKMVEKLVSSWRLLQEVLRASNSLNKFPKSLSAKHLPLIRSPTQ